VINSHIARQVFIWNGLNLAANRFLRSLQWRHANTNI